MVIILGFMIELKQLKTSHFKTSIFTIGTEIELGISHKHQIYFEECFFFEFYFLYQMDE